MDGYLRNIKQAHDLIYSISMNTSDVELHDKCVELLQVLQKRLDDALEYHSEKVHSVKSSS